MDIASWERRVPGEAECRHVHLVDIVEPVEAVQPAGGRVRHGRIVARCQQRRLNCSVPRPRRRRHTDHMCAQPLPLARVHPLSDESASDAQFTELCSRGETVLSGKELSNVMHAPMSDIAIARSEHCGKNWL